MAEKNKANWTKEKVFKLARTLPIKQPAIDFFGWLNDRKTDDGWNPIREENIREWKEYIRKEFPDLAGRWCKTAFEGSDDAAIGSVETVLNIHRFAYLLVDYAEEYRQRLTENNPHFYYHSLPFHAVLWIGRPEGDQDGIISFDVPEWAEAFRGADISKVLRCKNCEKVFWQSRKDKLHCSKGCSNATQVKKLRSDPEKREIINENRRYAYSVKKKKEKRNGSL